MSGFRELPAFVPHGVVAFVGGCYLRGVGSKFRAKAHAHTAAKIICFRGEKWINCNEVLMHELAHVLTGRGHDDTWRAKVLELGGTVAEVPGVLRSYEKKTRGIL